MRAPVLAVAALAALSGCAASAPTDAADRSAPPATAGPSTAELEAIYWARTQADLERFTDADVAFVSGMIGHHAQALVMADLAMRNGAAPVVQRLAARIDNAQRDEIRTMQTWLADRGLPVPSVPELGDDDLGTAAGMDHGAMDHGGMDHEGMDHAAMGHGAHAGMPGMLTDAQLAELAAARGPAFDRLFLTYMIRHHAGAVTMVDDLFASDGAAQNANTFKLASDIQVDQRTEIARMQLLLDALADDS